MTVSQRFADPETIVLASASGARGAMLAAAGVACVADPANIDETAVKRDCKTRGLDARGTAEVLALAKAERVQGRHPGRIVLGADQMLDCEGVWFDKPEDRAAAARQIGLLAGRSHRLISAAVAVRDGAAVWRMSESAELTMRPLSVQFIESYLDQVGDQALNSVGGYQVEGLGVQLFSAIRGDHFTILGLPLLPLLDFLRHQRVIAT